MIFSGVADVCEWYDEASASFAFRFVSQTPDGDLFLVMTVPSKSSGWRQTRFLRGSDRNAKNRVNEQDASNHPRGRERLPGKNPRRALYETWMGSGCADAAHLREDQCPLLGRGDRRRLGGSLGRFRGCCESGGSHGQLPLHIEASARDLRFARDSDEDAWCRNRAVCATSTSLGKSKFGHDLSARPGPPDG